MKDSYPEEGVGDFRDDAAEPTDGEVVAAASDRVDRNDMAERSRECLAGGVLGSVRRRAFVPGAKSGGSPASPSSRSAYHFTASIRSPKRGACSVMVEPSAAWRLHSNVRGYKRSSSGSTVA